MSGETSRRGSLSSQSSQRTSVSQAGNESKQEHQQEEDEELEDVTESQEQSRIELALMSVTENVGLIQKHFDDWIEGKNGHEKHKPFASKCEGLKKHAALFFEMLQQRGLPDELGEDWHESELRQHLIHISDSKQISIYHELCSKKRERQKAGAAKQDKGKGKMVQTEQSASQGTILEEFGSGGRLISSPLPVLREVDGQQQGGSSSSSKQQSKAKSNDDNNNDRGKGKGAAEVDYELSSDLESMQLGHKNARSQSAAENSQETTPKRQRTSTSRRKGYSILRLDDTDDE